jgi:hypothetical protein
MKYQEYVYSTGAEAMMTSSQHGYFVWATMERPPLICLANVEIVREMMEDHHGVHYENVTMTKEHPCVLDAQVVD